jgi:hypothetical protein
VFKYVLLKWLHARDLICDVAGWSIGERLKSVVEALVGVCGSGGGGGRGHLLFIQIPPFYYTQIKRTCIL